MDEVDKIRGTIQNRRSFGANISKNGKHGTTEQQALQRATTRKITDAETASLSKDKRVELAGTELDEACEQFEKTMSARGHRPFVDQTGFVYLLTLVRKDILKNRLEKHHIKMRYASHFYSQHNIDYPMCHRATEGKSQGSNKGKLFRSTADSGSDPKLPPCPVPLYFFPKSYPYSRNPVIESSLPRYLRPSNPKLRVHIPDPWALSLQLFESDPISASRTSRGRNSSASGLPKETDYRELKSYACYSIYTRSGQIHVQTLAPAGSTFDLAWDMFCNFFSKRVGVDWRDLHDECWNGINFERPLREKLRGEDGADDGGNFHISKLIKPHFRYGGDEAVVEPIESRSRKPSVTVLMNVDKPIMDDQVDVQAKTPEGGW